MPHINRYDMPSPGSKKSNSETKRNLIELEGFFIYIQMIFLHINESSSFFKPPLLARKASVVEKS